MGYDMYTVDNEEYFRANIWGMSLLRGAMETANVLDLQQRNPEWTKISDELQESDPDAWDKANSDKVAFQSIHFNKVPIGKFCSNDGWHVLPHECLIIANGLQEILNSEQPIHFREYDWKNGGYVTKECTEDEKKYIAEFKEYCHTASNQGGFKVW